MRQVPLYDDFLVLDVSNINAGKFRRLTFVDQLHDTAAVFCFLNGHAFAHAAKSVQSGLGNKLHVFDFVF